MRNARFWALVFTLSVTLGCGLEAPAGPAPAGPVAEIEEEPGTEPTTGAGSELADGGSSSSGGESITIPEFGTAEIALRRTGALGYCPQTGMVVSGDFTMHDLMFRGIRTTYGEPCWNSAIGGFDHCASFEEFTLEATTAQLAELEARASAVPEYGCDQYPGIVCDPCLVTTLRIGERTVNDVCCGRMKRSYQVAFTALASFLDELAGRSR